jgi:outer membrane lipoprotein SlyB
MKSVVEKTGSQLAKGAVLCSCLVFSACSVPQSGALYSPDSARRALELEEATVLSTRHAVIEEKVDQVGAVAGAGLGGTLGYALGAGAGPFRPLVMAGMGLGGLVSGPWVERHLKRRSALEIEIEHADGRRSIVVQDADEVLTPGKKVLLIRDASNSVHVRPRS